MASNKQTPSASKLRSKRPSSAKLDHLIKEAIVDANGESEQAVGFYTMLEDNLAVPFRSGDDRRRSHRSEDRHGR